MGKKVRNPHPQQFKTAIWLKNESGREDLNRSRGSRGVRPMLENVVFVGVS